MRYSHCKCGKCESWGSDMTLLMCSVCPYCGTDYMGNPPTPHKWIITEVDKDEGMKSLTICAYCLKTKKQIEVEKK